MSLYAISCFLGNLTLIDTPTLTQCPPDEPPAAATVVAMLQLCLGRVSLTVRYLRKLADLCLPPLTRF